MIKNEEGSHENGFSAELMGDRNGSLGALAGHCPAQPWRRAAIKRRVHAGTTP
ncbi:hypothetical protein [Cyclobacterium xiamenense]|uniref:hypothetical protein n=1 Tax=Cyclobacterium xiamenense TaxID=1297121 RepID=UPI0035CF16E7